MEKLEAEGMVILDIPEPENSWDLQTPLGRARLYFEGKKTPVPTYTPPVNGDVVHRLNLDGVRGVLQSRTLSREPQQSDADRCVLQARRPGLPSMRQKIKLRTLEVRRPLHNQLQMA